jgi:hypothetical protein
MLSQQVFSWCLSTRTRSVKFGWWKLDTATLPIDGTKSREFCIVVVKRQSDTLSDIFIGDRIFLLAALIALVYPLYDGLRQSNRDRRQRLDEQKLRTTREKDKYLYSPIKRQRGRVTLLEYAKEVRI